MLVMVGETTAFKRLNSYGPSSMCADHTVRSACNPCLTHLEHVQFICDCQVHTRMCKMEIGAKEILCLVRHAWTDMSLIFDVTLDLMLHVLKDESNT